MVTLQTSGALHIRHLRQDEPFGFYQWSTKRVVLSEEQNDGTHPTNSRFHAAAVKTSCLPVWNMGDMWTGPSADSQSRRMCMDIGWRQQCKASCLEHSVDGFESLPSTGQVRLLQKHKWLWWKELVQEDTLEMHRAWQLYLWQIILLYMNVGTR